MRSNRRRQYLSVKGDAKTRERVDAAVTWDVVVASCSIAWFSCWMTESP